MAFLLGMMLGGSCTVLGGVVALVAVRMPVRPKRKRAEETDDDWLARQY